MDNYINYNSDNNGQENYQESYPVEKKKFDLKAIIPSIIGVFVGICIIILGANVADSGNYISGDLETGYLTTTDHSYYGGDAYTGMQNAAADAANNAAAIGYMLEDINSDIASVGNNISNAVSAIGSAIVTAGIITSAVYVIKIVEIAIAKKEDTV